MKVLLINPSYPFEECPTPPFGLMSLAAYLLQCGIDVIIEDYIVTPYSREKIKSVIETYKPDVIGATGVTMNINTSLRVLKDCKEINLDIPTVMGGPHVSFDAQDILSKNSYIDYIIRGEGELTFVEFLEKIGSGETIKDVSGISYKKSGEVIHNPQRPFIEDINILPYAARHLVKLSKYKALGFPLNMITSRGCPHKCIFCVGSKMIGQKVRYFSVKRVVDEFEMLSKWGFKQINIVDDLFTANKQRCIEICDEMLSRGIKHKWNAFSRVDTVSKELLLKLREAGCMALCFGIESGNQEILDSIKKRTTLEKCKKAVDLCYECDVEPMASYIIGLPGESRETVEKSLKFAQELCPNHGFHILSPFPGTEIREKSKEYGLKILTDDWDKYDANISVSETEFLSKEEIDEISRQMNATFEKYIAGLKNHKKNKKPLTEKDVEFLNNIARFCFSRDLIMEEFVEAYPGINNNSTRNEVIENFISFITVKSNYPEIETRERISSLLDLNCITIDNFEGTNKVNWVQYGV